MVITRYVSDLMFSNMYILTENGHSLIVDPCGRCVLPNNINPDLIILTHEHYDHISGVNWLKERFGIPLLCSEQCAQGINDPRKNAARYFDAFCQLQSYGEQDMSVPIDDAYRCQAELTFKDQLCFNWQGNQVRLFTLPGHSPGSIGMLVDNKYFFSGDSLLPDREIELRFPGGSKKDWFEVSVKKLNALHDDIIVYPGHREKFLMKERRNHGCISNKRN